MDEINNQGNINSQTIIQIENMQGSVVAPNSTIGIPAPFASSLRSGTPTSVGWKPSAQYYSLFVRDDDAPVSGEFLFPKECALTSCIAPAVKARFETLSDSSIVEILTFPTIIASVNRNNGRTDGNHYAQYGRISGITFESAGIRIAFQHMHYLPQQRLNEIASDLELNCASLRNELDQQHWTIKEVNLQDALAEAGIRPIY
jgi:hypothetical protein